MRKWQSVVGIIVLIFGVAFAGFAVVYKNFLDTPLVSGDSLSYILKPGSSIRVLAQDLKTQGVLKQPEFLVLLAYCKGATKDLKAGEYLFVPGTKPSQLLDQIVAGKVVYQRFTIVEGWTFKQLLTALNHDPNLKHTLNDLTVAEIVHLLKLAESDPEGLFFPATYRFNKGDTDVSLLHKAYQMLNTKLAAMWQQRNMEIPYQTPYQALIAASLIEKETARDEERPMISGVLVRRLEKNMPLQIDSTIIYGLGNGFTGKLHTADLRHDTPYNTYTRKGLPPTPIAMPSEQSIDAALHPAVGDALYFVAKGNGQHEFSSNLAQHNVAVAAYQINPQPSAMDKEVEQGKCSEALYLSDYLQLLLSMDCQWSAQKDYAAPFPETTQTDEKKIQ